MTGSLSLCYSCFTYWAGDIEEKYVRYFMLLKQGIIISAKQNYRQIDCLDCELGTLLNVKYLSVL